MPAQKRSPHPRDQTFPLRQAAAVLFLTSPFVQGPQEAKGPSLSSGWVGTVPFHSSPGDPGSPLPPCQADRHTFPYISWLGSKGKYLQKCIKCISPSEVFHKLAVAWDSHRFHPLFQNVLTPRLTLSKPRVCQDTLQATSQTTAFPWNWYYSARPAARWLSSVFTSLERVIILSVHCPQPRGALWCPLQAVYAIYTSQLLLNSLFNQLYQTACLCIQKTVGTKQA